MYNNWIDRQTGEKINSCSIISTEAKGIKREIHNSKMRMPLVIENNQMEDWLQNREINLFYNFKTSEVKDSICYKFFFNKESSQII